MSTQPDIPEKLQLQALQTIYRLQQDQLKALGIIEALIKEVEKLNQRMKKLEQDIADAKGRLEPHPDPFDDAPGG
jgi:hypothetical protein